LDTIVLISCVFTNNSENFGLFLLSDTFKDDEGGVDGCGGGYDNNKEVNSYSNTGIHWLKPTAHITLGQKWTLSRYLSQRFVTRLWRHPARC
jgi:hypothetical protein